MYATQQENIKHFRSNKPLHDIFVVDKMGMIYNNAEISKQC